MRDEDRAAISKIGEVLEDLRRRWKNPYREQQDYVRAFEVSSVNAMEQDKHPSLLARLEELENEQRRIHELLMNGQVEGTERLGALAANLERLRQDFAILGD